MKQKDEQTGEKIKTANLTFDEGLDPDLWKHLSTIQKSERNINDVAVTPHEVTHYPDALRSFAVSRMVASAEPLSQNKFKFEFYDDEKVDYFGTVTPGYINYGG